VNKYIVLALTLLMILGLMGGVAVAEDSELPNWNIEGEWLITTTFNSTTTERTLIVEEQDSNGNFTGTLGPVGGEPTGVVNGWVRGDDVYIEYTRPSISDYESYRVGVIASDGKSMAGEFSDTSSNEGTWEAEGEAYWIDYYKAAPAVAAELLKEADIDARYGSGRTGGNHIADVAHEMGDTTDFDGVSKCDVFEYEYAVADYLNTKDDPAEVAYPVSELQSVVYEGEGDLFGDHIDDKITFTFSNDVFHDPYVEVTFETAQELWESWGADNWTFVGNTAIVTLNREYGSPRNIVGDSVIDISGIVDAVANDVVVPEDGVKVTKQ